MNLDDLMEVWRSQDASPLYGVDEDSSSSGAAAGRGEAAGTAAHGEMGHLRRERVFSSPSWRFSSSS